MTLRSAQPACYGLGMTSTLRVGDSAVLLVDFDHEDITFPAGTSTVVTHVFTDGSCAVTAVTVDDEEVTFTARGDELDWVVTNPTVELCKSRAIEDRALALLVALKMQTLPVSPRVAHRMRALGELLGL